VEVAVNCGSLKVAISANNTSNTSNAMVVASASFELDYTQTSTKLSKLNQSHPGFESGFLDLDH